MRTLFILLLCLLQLLCGLLLFDLQLQPQVVDLLLLSSCLFRMRLLHARNACLQSCDGVGELRLLSSQFDWRVCEHLLHRRSLGRILLQHLHNQKTKLGGVERRQACRRVVNDLLGECDLIGSDERRLKGGELIQQTTERPGKQHTAA